MSWNFYFKHSYYKKPFKYHARSSGTALIGSIMESCLTKLQSVSVIKFKKFLDLLTAMPFISSYYHRHIQRVMTSHDSPTRIYKAYKIKLKKLKEQKM